MSLSIIKAALRGIVKGFPLINAIVETVKNIKAKKAIKTEVITEAVTVTLQPSVSGNGEAVGAGVPHNWVSIAFQVIATAVILYGFFTKQVTVDSVMEFLNQFI